MRLVIEERDFKRLPANVQKELFKQFAGRDIADAPAPNSKLSSPHRWSAPIDLDHDLTVKLMHGLGRDHRDRLALLARNGGRATMKELLEVTNDSDWHVLSYFQTVVTRKLRRILGDRENKVFLIAWDYGATKWNKDRTEILDGVYFVTERSAKSLREFFHAG